MTGTGSFSRWGATFVTLSLTLPILVGIWTYRSVESVTVAWLATLFALIVAPAMVGMILAPFGE